MLPKHIRTKYKDFFQGSEAGLYFVTALDEMITALHEKSEKAPESARDNAQRAAGVREVINHIRTFSADIKTKSPVERGKR